jgi:hypothetical protein
MQLLFRMSSFTVAHDDDLEHPAQQHEEVHDDDLEHPTHEQEARCTMMISFEFPWSLKNSATTFQEVVRQSATTYLIDGLTRPPIGTSSMTTRSFGLVLTEIRTMKPEE